MQNEIESSLAGSAKSPPSLKFKDYRYTGRRGTACGGFRGIFRDDDVEGRFARPAAGEGLSASKKCLNHQRTVSKPHALGSSRHNAVAHGVQGAQFHDAVALQAELPGNTSQRGFSRILCHWLPDSILPSMMPTRRQMKSGTSTEMQDSSVNGFALILLHISRV